MSKQNGNGNVAYGSGLGFCGVLCIVFIVLKLTGVITWSWVWVLSPIWITWIIAIFLIVIALVLFKRYKKE